MPTPAVPRSTASVARKLRLAQLMVLDQVLESGSILHAAHVLAMSQPAVSKAVQDLEAYFGMPLLVRGNRGVVATSFGLRMARRARRVLSELHDLGEEAAALTRGAQGTVRIGTLVAASTTLLPKAVQQVKAATPGVLVSIRFGEFDELLAALAAGRLDLLVARVPQASGWAQANPGVRVDHLYTESMRLVAGAGHPCAQADALTLADLALYPWIIPTADSPLRGSVDALFAGAGLPLPVDLIESLTFLANVSLLAGGRRVSIMSRGVAQPFVEAGMLVELPLDPHIGFEVALMRRADADPGPAVHRLCERLVDLARENSGTAPVTPAPR